MIEYDPEAIYPRRAKIPRNEVLRAGPKRLAAVLVGAAGTVRVVEQPGLALRDPTPCCPREQVSTAFICTSWSGTRAIGAYDRGRRSGFSTNED